LINSISSRIGVSEYSYLTAHQRTESHFSVIKWNEDYKQKTSNNDKKRMYIGKIKAIQLIFLYKNYCTTS